MTEPSGEHVEKTEKRWTAALRDPDPDGGFVRYVCDRIEVCVEHDFDDETSKQMIRRAKKLKLKHLDVWNAFVALVLALRKKNVGG